MVRRIGQLLGGQNRLRGRAFSLGIESLEHRCLLAALTLSDFYTSGKGSGLHMQELEGYALSTTQGTRIAGSTRNSALEGAPSTHATGASPLRDGFEFSAAEHLLQWDLEVGGTAPWLIRPELVGQPGAATDLEYPKLNVPDSAMTATTLYSGVKTYNGALGVDIFEVPAGNMLEIGRELGKSSGVVSSVALNHATPAAAIAHHNLRTNRDNDYPDLGNSLQQALLETKPTVLMGAGHPVANRFSWLRETTYNALKDPADGRYDDWTVVERGPNAAARLAAAAEDFDPEAERQFMGLFGTRRQNGNLPWATANGDFGNTGRGGRSSARILSPGETAESVIARETDENPRLFEMTDAALKILEKDQEGFWLMVEGGDIDWAMHDNSLDNAIGSVLEFDLAVKSAVDWVQLNGGFEENLLIVLADHDHYLTLNDDFPELVAAKGVQGLTPAGAGDSLQNGHYWGSDPLNQFGYRLHTSIPVPVYYQGPEDVESRLSGAVGQGFTAYGQPVAGTPGMIDHVHVFEAMQAAFVEGAAKNVILMIGDGMGWEMARAAAIAKQVSPNLQPKARVDGSGMLSLSGTPGDDSVVLIERDGMIAIESDGLPVAIEIGGQDSFQVDRDVIADFRFVGRQSQDQLSAVDVTLDIFLPGDANRDLRFNQLDVVLVLQGGKYLSGETATWREGDWTGDGVFNQLDLLAALQGGPFLVGGQAALSLDADVTAGDDAGGNCPGCGGTGCAICSGGCPGCGGTGCAACN